MVADITFFCLDTKEPKDQAFRIASGRNAALRAWVDTVLVVVLACNRYRIFLILKYSFCLKVRAASKAIAQVRGAERVRGRAISRS